MKLVLKLVCVPIFALGTGLVFGIAPCYLFPLIIDGSTRTFCGYKSGPPHFELQCMLGVAAGFVFIVWFLFLHRRRASPP